jgi:hypothetical protein
MASVPGFKDLKLVECTEEAWNNFYSAFRGICGLKGCKRVLQVGRGEDLEDAEYNKQCDMLHSLLSYSCSANAEATMILQGYIEDTSCGGMDNGRAALDDIRQLCKGGEGMETVEGYLTLINAIHGDEFDSVRELAAHHQSLVTKATDLTIRSQITIKDFLNLMFKIHLLRCLRAPRYGAQYGNPLSISHSKEETKYEDLQKEIVRVSNVLNSTDGFGSETGDMKAEAFFTKNKTYNNYQKKRHKCFRCESTKHLIADCPHEPDSDEEEERPKLGTPGPGTLSGRQSRAQKKAQADHADLAVDDEVVHTGWGWTI